MCAGLFSCATTGTVTDLARQSFNLGNALTQLGDTDGAESAFLVALEEYPEYLEASYNLALLYTEEEEYTKAYAVVDEILRVYPDSRELLVLQAYLIYYLGDASGALKKYEELIDRFDEPALHLDCAKIALETGEYDTARRHLMVLFDQGDLSGELIFLLGELDRLSGESDGMDWYIVALLENPGYRPALDKVLIHFEEEGLSTEGRIELDEILGEAMSKAPSDPQIAYYRARNLLLLGDVEGVSLMQKAVQLGFEDTDKLLEIYDELEGEIASVYLSMLEMQNIVRVVELTDMHIEEEAEP